FVCFLCGDKQMLNEFRKGNLQTDIDANIELVSYQLRFPKSETSSLQRGGSSGGDEFSRYNILNRYRLGIKVALPGRRKLKQMVLTNLFIYLFVCLSVCFRDVAIKLAPSLLFTQI